jgi:DNA-binding response OmpR family regulator
VEDETIIALELDDFFKSVGFNVVGPFGNLTQATQALAAEAIDFAILDTNLNGEMVYPLAEELLRHGIPFLFLTGYDASDLPDRFRTIPRVSKPFDQSHLMEQIRVLVIRKKRHNLDDLEGVRVAAK